MNLPTTYSINGNLKYKSLKDQSKNTYWKTVTSTEIKRIVSANQW